MDMAGGGPSGGESKRLHIEVRGRVQGVGFRPTVYRYATARGLAGWISNTSEGVVIEVEGPGERVDDFLSSLRASPPPRAEIAELESRDVPLAREGEFTIRPSRGSAEAGAVRAEVAPDLCVCPDCIREMSEPGDRRRAYPFLNCTNCGPRFTIVEGIPYDRSATTMRKFAMCEACRKEYEDPLDRRFHAQPTACPSCGPKASLLSSDGAPQAEGEAAVRKTAELLREGSIVAVKGLGGFHLACDALDSQAVETLRGRKYREDKPFAVMARDMAVVERLCRVSAEERESLESVRRPIVLLARKPGAGLPEAVSPRQETLGVLLPYTPLHHLLFESSAPPLLVMTSGNVSDEPICHENEEALGRLKGIADAFLVHDRDIHIRCDDSVLRVLEGAERLIRRARGCVPSPIRLPARLPRPLLACGAELKNTFCVARDQEALLSHHIGDLENLQTLGAFEQGVAHFERIFRLKPEVLACDRHPDYLSTRYAEERSAREGLPLVRVQHHHAHIASCLADNGRADKVIGLAFDGTGYGDDGAVWGGEFLVADAAGFRRAAHLRYVPLPGGDTAVRETWRMAASWLYQAYGESFLDLGIPFAREFDLSKWDVLRAMMDRDINSPKTSSMGRLFDAVSALVGVRSEVRYEGQAAVELEAAAVAGTGSTALLSPYPFLLLHDPVPFVLDFVPTIRAIVDDLLKGAAPAEVAARFHKTVAEAAVGTCVAIKNTEGLDAAALSGGVFQNALLLELMAPRLRQEGFEVLLHRQVPANDGGLCLGQAVVAAASDRGLSRGSAASEAAGAAPGN